MAFRLNRVLLTICALHIALGKFFLHKISNTHTHCTPFCGNFTYVYPGTRRKRKITIQKKDITVTYTTTEQSYTCFKTSAAVCIYVCNE